MRESANDNRTRMATDNHRSEICSLCSDLLSHRRDAVLSAFLIGSCARGAENEITSDVDILLVTESYAPRNRVEDIEEVFAQSRLPFDIVAVDAEPLQSDEFPTVVRFLVKPTGGLIWQDDPRTDTLLARQDAAECGVFLGGTDPGFRPKPVPWRLLRRSILAVFPHIRPRFKNPALSLARVRYSLHTQSLCSKQAAGEWGLTNMSGHYSTMLRLDLEAYATGRKAPLPSGILAELENEIRSELLE